MNATAEQALGKVPEVTLIFWIIKVAATTLGETGGDAASMSMNLGYLVGTAIFAFIFILAVAAQVKATQFRPFLYWTTIIATTTVGTTLADFADRSLGIGYAGGTLLLSVLLVTSLSLWYRSLGSISVHAVSSPNTGQAPPERCSSGRPSSLPGRLARSWVIFSTSRSAPAAWT